MKVYHLHRQHTLPIVLAEAWNFFSSPHNLVKITPKEMGFKVLSTGGVKMYAGQIIQYDVQIFPLVTVRWVTEITHVQEPSYFVDEQRFGPYAFWHHQHRFTEVNGGVEMTDDVHYAIPFGLVGRLANSLFVEKKLQSIFDYRTKIVASQFSAV